MSNQTICATFEQWQWAESHARTDVLPSVGDDSLPRVPSIKPGVSTTNQPSFINSRGLVERYTGWNSVQVTSEMIADWKSHPEYNVCIRTTNIRAVDLDIDNRELADKIEALFTEMAGVPLPTRYRDNSPRRTMLLRLDPTSYISRRAIITEHGKIEGLFNGSQTLWAGMHKSGVLFKHRNHENGIPVVSLSRFEELWDRLVETYNPRGKRLIDSNERQGEYLARNANQITPDAVAEYIIANGLAVSFERSGKINVRCPNHDNHTDKTNDNSSTWLPAGLGGVKMGAFHCMHTGCSHIRTKDFKDFIGYTEYEMTQSFGGDKLLPHPSVTVERNIIEAPAQMSIEQMTDLAARNGVANIVANPNVTRDNKGRITKAVNNLTHVLLDKAVVDSKFNKFDSEIYVRVGGTGAYNLISDNIVTSVRLAVERITNVTFSHEEVSRQLSYVSQNNQYDSAIDWIHQQEWDGELRIERFAEDILKCRPVDREYGTVLSQYLFVALVGRVLEPGVKADISPVFVSQKQGTGKSSLIAALAPFHEWFGTVDLTNHDDDLFRQIKGKVVIELPELRGLSGRDASATKALLTQQVDSWVPKYREHAIKVPRRCLFIGSDNRSRFLTDATGNRRWAPIQVAKTGSFIDWPKYVDHRDQYWAEARHIISRHGSVQAAVEHYSSMLREKAAPAVADATMLDPLHKTVQDFLNGFEPLKTVELAAIAQHIWPGGLATIDNFRVNRLRNIMLVLKYEEVDHDTWQVPVTL